MDNIFDLDILKQNLRESEEFEDMDGNKLKSVYLGSCLNILPSGKFYMPWSSNVTGEEAEKDIEWFEQAKKELDSIGAWLGGSDGDGCDMFVFACAEDFGGDNDGSEND